MNSTKGFTLIELLVVISIIGLLSSIILVSLNTARTKAYDAQRLSNLLNVQTALEVYYTANNSYPLTNGSFYGQCTGSDVVVAVNNTIPGLVPTYIPSLPIDSKTNGTNQCCYMYQGSATDYKFMLFSCPASASIACYSATVGTEPSLPDPHRAATCAVYTTGAKDW